MGAFLTKPVTDTFPMDDSDGKYAFGASSMQGYRTSQEDAHLCLLDFDKDTYLFGVFDGHGGAEVAEYTSKKFPEFLKNNEAYKNNDFERALREAFIEFDASLVREDVSKELKRLAGDNMSSAEEDEDMQGNLTALKEEAKLPIRELLERFATGASTKGVRKAKLKAQQSIEESIASGEQCSSSSVSSKQDEKSMEPCSSSKSNVENGDLSSSSVSPNASKSTTREEVSSTLTEEENEAGCSSSNVIDDITDQPSSSNQERSPQVASKSCESEPSSTDQAESTAGSSEGDDDETPKAKKRINPTRISSSLSLLEMLNEDYDEEDSDDDSMLADEDDSEDEMLDDSESEDCSESSEDDSDDVSDEEDEEASPKNGVQKDRSHPLRRFMFDEGPGCDSGCTAVICLLKNNKLYVANAGDSRAVLCRGGKAVALSEDHKPTSEIEYARIKKAGGKVTQDGRVNGGLNLSRAFGDHSYKTNKDLPLEEQMITALPDIQSIDIESDDDFIVIACDGIWNSMNNEEVVEYICEELKKEKKLSKICDSLFFKCLAEDTRGDGSGCDNQTCIIVKLKDLPVKEDTSEANGEVKENKTDAHQIVEDSNDELTSKNASKRKRDSDSISVANGANASIMESPTNKKTKSDLES